MSRRCREQREGLFSRVPVWRDESGDESEQEERRGTEGKRSRLPVSIDPPRRSRAHLVFHPTSSSIPPCATRDDDNDGGDGDDDEEETGDGERTVPSEAWPVLQAWENASANATSHRVQRVLLNVSPARVCIKRSFHPSTGSLVTDRIPNYFWKFCPPLPPAPDLAT